MPIGPEKLSSCAEVNRSSYLRLWANDVLNKPFKSMTVLNQIYFEKFSEFRKSEEIILLTRSHLKSEIEQLSEALIDNRVDTNVFVHYIVMN